jgi:hypothetical protein
LLNGVFNKRSTNQRYNIMINNLIKALVVATSTAYVSAG